MKRMKTSGCKNYRPIPQNEYTFANLARSTDTAGVLEYDPQSDDAEYKQRLMRRQAQHPYGSRKVRGWSRAWKANGWRAESAALQDEFIGVGRYSSYVRKNSRPSL